MKHNIRTKTIGALLCLAFIVSLILALSVPAQAKSTIPVVMSTANGDTVEWSSKVGSNDGYWEITAVNDGYEVNICSGVTDHEAGSYALSDLESNSCFIIINEDTYFFIEGSCAVIVFGDAVNVSGVFKADNNNYYAVDITYGTLPAVTFAKVASADDITSDNIKVCTMTQAKAWVLDNWDDVMNTTADYIEIVFSDGTNLSDFYFMPGMTKEQFASRSNTAATIDEVKGYYNDGDDIWICTGVAAAPVTEWHVGDTINIGGKYYINDDQGAPSSCGFDRDVIVSEPVYETMYNQWIFENVIASNASEAFALYISLPAGKTEADVPAGFKVKSGDGTQASPYEFELVYEEAASSKFVVTFSTDQPHVGLAVDTTATFACDSQGNGRLDQFIKIILGGNPTASGLSASIAPTVTGGNGAVVAGLNNGNQYLTINERFDGNVTVSGKYYMGGEETDYSFTIACSDYVAVESVSLSPDTAQEINVDGTVAITPTVSPDGAYESVVEVTVGGTDSGAVALYLDADCNYSIPPIVPSGMPFYVKGVSAGTATITITSPEDENITASIDITVNAAAPATAYAGYVPTATDDAAALAAKVVKFDGMDWYLIEDNSTAVDAGTVTLLAKECVGASTFGDNNTYSGSTVETYVNNWYAESISTGAKTAVSNNKMFLLSTDEAKIIYNANSDVLKCSKASDAEENVWWLCSQGYDYYYAAGVYGEDGEVDEDGYNLSYELGVRPALQLDLSKVEFDSSTNTFEVPAAPTEWHVGDTINLGGKYFYYDDSDTTSKKQAFDRDITVPTPEYYGSYSQWSFDPGIADSAESYIALWLTPPTGKTADDKPIGFKVKSGDGTQASPYEFELVYPTTFGKVNSVDDITAENIGECTFDDAKEWIYANWDTVIADAYGEGYVDIVYFAGEDLYYIYLANNDVKEYWYTGATSGSTTSIDELKNWVDQLGDTIYLCGYKAPAVKYLDENGDEQSCANYFLVNENNNAALDVEGVTIGSEALGGDFTWIVVGGEVTFTNVINVGGTANVILKDGATLTANKGVYVPEGSTLNIYAQSTGDDMGVVVATGSSGCAGIGSGSNYDDACGTIVINGGNITATGGTNASGIGGSKGGTITVNGGYVEANGSYSPGIGVPADGVVGGMFTFNGGTVIANGGDQWSAGIGGYNECMGTGTIVIGEGLGLQVSADNSTWEDKTHDTTDRARYMKVGVIEYPLWVGGVQVTSANAMDTTAHPTWGYSAYTHTLTLNGYTNSGTVRADIQSGVNNAAIYYNDNMSSPNPLTIQLAEGTTNSLTMTGDRVYGIYVFGSALTITGNGTLNVQSDDMAINDAWGVAITGGTVNAASGEYYGIGSVTIGADISSVTVTGKLGAIYGGSNEDQELINAVAGTGWTDTAGTTGEADIAISTTGQNVSSYKKVQFPAVEHVLPSGLWVGGTEVTDTVTSGDGWSYNASTNTLTLTDYYYDGDGFAYTNKNSAGIYYKGESPLNIVVEKTQSYSYIGGYENNFVGIYAEGGVVLTGEGRLIIYGNSGGIICDVTVDGCVLEVTCGEVDGKGSTAVTNLTVNSGKVTVDGGTVSGNGVVGGYAVETLTVNGGIVYAYGGDGYNSYEPTTQSAVKTLTVSGGVLYAKGGVSNWNSDLVPAVVTTADGGSITVGKDIKVYGADIRNSERHDMPNTLIEEEGGDFDRFFYMIFECPSVKVTVPYKDHTWTDGALVTTDKEMSCDTMTFSETTWSGNYYVDHNVTFGTIDNPVNITLTGNTNIILSDTATLYVYGTIDCGDYTLNIYGNEMGDGGYSKVAFHSGAFTVNNTSEKALALKASEMNIHGGTVEVNSTGDYDDTMFVVEADEFSVYAGSFRAYVNGEKGLSALASASTNVYGGRFNVSGGQSSGENADGGTGFTGSLCVYGGYVNAYGGDAYGNGADGGIGIIGNVEVYGGQVSTSGGYSSKESGGIAFVGTLEVYGGTFDADGGYGNGDQDNNMAISATVTLGEGVGYFEGKTLFAEGPEEEMESGDANYAQIKGGAKYVYVDATTGAVTTAYTYEASSRIDYWLWSNWYIVEKDTTINDAVYFETNEVNIIIADGVTLTFANGLNVPEGKTLKIYAQSMDEATMGTLIATGANGSAGIGGENGGNVYIYSGNVEATGATGAAGIDGIVYIYGGKVTATGGEGSVGINGDLTLGEGVTLYGDDDVNPPTTVIEEESGNYHRTQYMISIYGSAASISGTPTAAQNLTYTGSAQVLITADPTVTGGTLMYSTDQQTWYTRENFKATAAGTYNVYYYAAGDDDHDDSEVFGGTTFTVEIAAKTVTVTAEAKTKSYGDADPALTYTATGLVGNDKLTGKLARDAGENVGSYAITKGTLAASNNYTIQFTGATLTVGKKTVTVTADDQVKKVGDADPGLTYSVSGLAAGDSLMGAPAREAGEDEGMYAITQGTLSVGENYTLNFTEGTLTIVSADSKIVKVTATAVTKAYGDADPELTYTVEGLAEGETLTGALAREAGENVGSYAITLGTLSAGSNYTISFTGANLTVTAKEVKVTATAATKTFGSADPELTYTVEGLAEGETLTGSLARAEGENVGTYAITQGTLTAGSNYTISFTGADLTITAKTVTVKADDQRKLVGTEDPELTYTVEGLAEGEALTGALAREAGETEGTYAITLGTLTTGSNYTISFTGATFTVYENKVETDVTVDEGAPEMEIENIDEEAAGSLLTEEEKEALEKGEEVKIYLEVIAIDEEIVPEGDKTEIEKEAEKSGMTVGMYLDMSLLKKVGSTDAVAIHDTEGNMVKVTVTVPENLRNTNPNVKRTFYVVRVHDGKTEILGQSTGDTVSFETDKFSTYSLTYKDSVEKEEAKPASLTWLWILLAVLAVAGAGVGIFFFIKKKNGGAPTDNTDKPETTEPENTEEPEKSDE